MSRSRSRVRSKSGQSSKCNVFTFWASMLVRCLEMLSLTQVLAYALMLLKIVEIESWEITLVKIFKMNKERGMWKLVGISAFVFELSKDMWWLHLPSPPPSRLLNLDFVFSSLRLIVQSHQCRFFKMIGWPNPKHGEQFLSTRWHIQGGRAHIVTDSDFCWPF